MLRFFNINHQSTHFCPFIKVNSTLTVSTLLHRLVLSINLGTVHTGTGQVDPARKFKCTTAARESSRAESNM